MSRSEERAVARDLAGKRYRAAARFTPTIAGKEATGSDFAASLPVSGNDPVVTGSGSGARQACPSSAYASKAEAASIDE